MKNLTLTYERLRQVVKYDPETGVFTWLIRLSPNIKVGGIAGSKDTGGYLQFMIDGRHYLSHRLAVLYMTGQWPDSDIDHKDLDKANNKWENLRRATESQNVANTALLARNTSGLKGVHWHKRDQKWIGSIRVNRKLKEIYRGHCPAAASFAYQVAADKAFGEFARFS
jgi:hypothetical protein